MPASKPFAILALAAFAIPASAQDINGEPHFGSVSLTAGFADDPYVVTLRSGGSVDSSRLGNGCRGFVSTRPDVRLNYSAGSLPLIISVDSNSDTTLVINGPDGRWYCDDDSGERGLNPAVRFHSPRSGRYEIWVGTYGSASNQPARLHISELGSQ